MLPTRACCSLQNQARLNAKTKLVSSVLFYFPVYSFSICENMLGSSKVCFIFMYILFSFVSKLHLVLASVLDDIVGFSSTISKVYFKRHVCIAICITVLYLQQSVCVCV